MNSARTTLLLILLLTGLGAPDVGRKPLPNTSAWDDFRSFESRKEALIYLNEFEIAELRKRLVAELPMSMKTTTILLLGEIGDHETIQALQGKDPTRMSGKINVVRNGAIKRIEERNGSAAKRW